MRVPKNIAKVNYTTGEKYLDSNFSPYVGYYCEVKGKIYPGKIYTGRSKQLILASSLVKNNKVPGIAFNPEDTWHSHSPEGEEIEDKEEEYVFRYFVKYIHTIPIYIKEVNIDTYNSIKNNPLYQTLMLKFTISDLGSFPNNGFFNKDEVEQANKTMHGIKLYLQEETV
jgi:hypothetical protein